MKHQNTAEYISYVMAVDGITQGKDSKERITAGSSTIGYSSSSHLVRVRIGSEMGKLAGRYVDLVTITARAN